MKKFVFSLAALEKLKKHLQEQKETAFHVAERELREQVSARDTLQKKAMGYQKEFSVQLTAGTSVDNIVQGYRYLTKMQQDLQSQADAINVTQKKVNEKRHEFQVAIRQHRVMERLHAEQYQLYCEDFSRQMQKELDEMGMQAYRRKNDAIKTEVTTDA